MKHALILRLLNIPLFVALVGALVLIGSEPMQQPSDNETAVAQAVRVDGKTKSHEDDAGCNQSPEAASASGMSSEQLDSRPVGSLDTPSGSSTTERTSQSGDDPVTHDGISDHQNETALTQTQTTNNVSTADKVVVNRRNQRSKLALLADDSTDERNQATEITSRLDEKEPDQSPGVSQNTNSEMSVASSVQTTVDIGRAKAEVSSSTDAAKTNSTVSESAAGAATSSAATAESNGASETHRDESEPTGWSTKASDELVDPPATETGEQAARTQPDTIRLVNAHENQLPVYFALNNQVQKLQAGQTTRINGPATIHFDRGGKFGPTRKQLEGGRTYRFRVTDRGWLLQVHNQSVD